MEFTQSTGSHLGQLHGGLTKVLPFKGCSNPDFKVEKEPVEARGVQQQSLFTSDFDFAKLGIGGLGNEFDTIFRRAFASRIYPGMTSSSRWVFLMCRACCCTARPGVVKRS